MNMILAIAGGGAIGAVLRHFFGALSLHFFGAHFPWGTLGVNIIGSFFMGILIALFAHYWSPSPELRAFLTVGLLGAFTTFSAFSLDAVTLYERGLILYSFGYIIASVFLSITALYAGLILIRQFFTS
ncbi:MAG: fluoride efflux transporter CrcB [Alphaproteobacteria bacterium]|nr:fluoride efflux transporter CrcB [Alphaproteobacteria bacterium]